MCACPLCRGVYLPALDASHVLGYNTNVRKENTVDPEKYTLIWNPLTPDSVPSARFPVLLKLKLKVQPIPLPRVGRDTINDTEEAKRSLLQRGVFYGYVTAVLDFNLDGFGRQVPACFRELVLNSPSNTMSTTHTIAFDKVEAWAVL